MLAVEAYKQNKVILDRNRARQRAEITLLSGIPKREKREKIIGIIADVVDTVFMIAVIGIFIDRLLAAWVG